MKINQSSLSPTHRRG